MAPFIRIVRSPLVAFAALLVSAGLTAAAAGDRCEGTFCDFYYDHVGTPPPSGKPAGTAAQPAPPAQAGDGVLGRLFGGAPAQPQADATPPAKKPMVAVQGGGVVGLMQGRAPQRCSGTLCDLYYGGPAPEEPAAAAEPAVGTAPSPAPRAAEAEIDEPVATSRGIEPRESVRSCAVNPRDPWACYRH